MNRSLGAILITMLVGSAAMAGTPPHWPRAQAVAAQRNDDSRTHSSRDARDEGRHDNGGDWKRRGNPQRIDQGTGSAPARPESGQNRPPVARDPAPSAGIRNDRGNWANDNRGDRRDARDPRPDTSRDRDNGNRGRDHDGDRDNDRNRGPDDRRWNRDRDWDRNHWRDDRGRDWHRERGWYDRYRADHFRFYNGRYFARERFRVNLYLAPFGYAPRLWQRGQFLPFEYYDASYFIGDYWTFNLYEPPFGCRWVRVRGDALLVDTASGEVVDAVYDLFW
jgi:Ni/Co efflux regulator RcnB